MREPCAGALEPVGFAAGQSLLAPGQRIERVVFPDSGVVSLVAEPGGSGAYAGVALVGCEGLLGLPALLGRPQAELRWLVRVGGEGRTVPIEALRARMLVSAALRDLVQRCASARRAAACAALHPLARRLAGRLLALQDRLGPGSFLTQAAPAETLDARWPTVNAELQNLLRAGLVRHTRGQIAIADRPGLEALACPCHAAAREPADAAAPRRRPAHRGGPGRRDGAVSGGSGVASTAG
jgi:CRP-like cAMP-binding protein